MRGPWALRTSKTVRTKAQPRWLGGAGALDARTHLTRRLDCVRNCSQHTRYYQLRLHAHITHHASTAAITSTHKRLTRTHLLGEARAGDSVEHLHGARQRRRGFAEPVVAAAV